MMKMIVFVVRMIDDGGYRGYEAEWEEEVFAHNSKNIRQPF